MQKKQQPCLCAGEELVIIAAKPAFTTRGEKRAEFIVRMCRPDDATTGGQCPAQTAPNAVMATIRTINVLHTRMIILRNISK